MHRIVLALLALALIAPPAVAQQPDTAKLPAALHIPREREIALARSAAPPAVADSAEIWVLGEKRYEKVKAGTNGYGCIVQRGMGGQSLIPRCDDPSGVEALFPVYQLIEAMRTEGRTYGDLRKAMADGYRTGEHMRGTGLSFVDFGTPECTLIVNTPPATARRADQPH